MHCLSRNRQNRQQARMWRNTRRALKPLECQLLSGSKRIQSPTFVVLSATCHTSTSSIRSNGTPWILKPSWLEVNRLMPPCPLALTTALSHCQPLVSTHRTPSPCLSFPSVCGGLCGTGGVVVFKKVTGRLGRTKEPRLCALDIVIGMAHNSRCSRPHPATRAASG